MGSSEKFQNYNWEADENWKSFKENVVSPNENDASGTEKLKKKYYQKFVDPSFVIFEDVKDSRSSAPDSKASYSSQNSSTSAKGKANGYLLSILAILRRNELILEKVWLGSSISLLLCSILFVVPIFSPNLFYRLALFSASITYLLSLYKTTTQTTNLDKEFLAVLMLNDNTHYLLYSIIFLNHQSLVFCLVPLCIYSLLHLSIYYKNRPFLIPGYNVTQYVNQVLSAQASLLNNGIQMELLVFPLMILMVFWGTGSVLLCFCYWQFLTQRYKCSASMKMIVDRAASVVDGFLTGPKVPSIVAQAYRKAKSYMNR